MQGCNTRTAGGVVIATCPACGATRSFKRENALARAAKVRAWLRAHDCKPRVNP